MQTFILAPQSPKKYYVHNDIFRYQDEVFHDLDGGVDSSNAQPVAAQQDASQDMQQGKTFDSTFCLAVYIQDCRIQQSVVVLF